MANLFDFIDTAHPNVPDQFGNIKTLYPTIIAPAMHPKYRTYDYMRGTSPAIRWSNPNIQIVLFPLFHYALPTSQFHFIDVREKPNTEQIEALENKKESFLHAPLTTSEKTPYTLHLFHAQSFYARHIALLKQLGYVEDVKASKILQLMNPDIVPTDITVLTTKDSVVILTKAVTLTTRSIRGITPLLPIWFKEAFAPLPEDIKTMLKALTQPIADTWFTQYQTFLNQAEFMETIIRTKIQTFAAQFSARRKEALTRQLNTAQQERTNALSRYTDLLRTINDIGGQILFADSEKAQIEPLADLLIKQLKMIPIFDTTNTDYIKMVIVAPLALYDPECLKPILKNNRADYTGSTGSKVHTLLQSIFLDEKYDLYCVSYIKLGLRDFSVSKSNTIPVSFSDGCMPIQHPHIMNHNCFGSNTTHISEALSRVDLLGAVQQTLSAAQNFNFSDATVVRDLCEYLRHDSNQKFIFDKTDGIFVSPNIVYEKEKK